MTYSKVTLKKQIEQWQKVYGTNSQDDQQLWYDIQAPCKKFRISFDELLKFMDGKKSTFQMSRLGKD